MTKVLGAFVFMGSATIGVMQNGVKPDRVLELVDGMSEDNAKHFVHNYPDIPIIEPAVWESDGYLEELRKEEYDLLYGNPPCSGLSLGVRGPQSHEKGPNCHQYRFMDIIKKVQPKAFMYENAPTLISTGKPILNDFIKQLPDYNFTVIRDFGMHHNVAMKRQRTFFIGWRKDIFEKIPTLHMNHQPKISVGDVIGDLQNVELGSFLNHVLIHDRAFQDVEHIFPDVPYVKGGEYTVNWIIVNEYEKYEPLLNEKTKKALTTQLYKQRAGLGYWDKSSQRPDPKGLAPSLTGYSSFIHPVLHRQFTIREYARLMGYPDTFEILDTKPGREVVRHIAQGVPANFFGYASGEVLAALKDERDSIQQFSDTRVTFQHHTKKTLDEFTTNEFLNTIKIHEIKPKDTNKKQELMV